MRRNLPEGLGVFGGEGLGEKGGGRGRVSQVRQKHGNLKVGKSQSQSQTEVKQTLPFQGVVGQGRVAGGGCDLRLQNNEEVKAGVSGK